MSWRWKVVSFLLVPLGLAYGGIPIFMEETGRWVTRDSLTYFAVTIPAIFIGAYLIWQRVTISLGVIEHRARASS
jgi:hypothetical protein